MVIAWNTGLAAERARHNRRLKNRKLDSFKRKKRQAASSKLQAPSAKLQAPSGKINWFKKKFDRDLK
tara:strand:+ start:114 stop:314 length:201 start_codon:yes stop_codon:yes gene_type:complete